MADNDQSLYVLRFNQITQQLEAQGGTPSWNPLSIADTLYTPENVRYVDGANGSDSNAGGPVAPFKTVQAAFNSIGSATTAEEYDNNATARCLVIVAPGVYTEDVILPQRQIVSLQLQGALIVGNVSQSFNGLIVTGANLQHKVIISGVDLRSAYSGANIPMTGIDGNLTSTVSNPAGMAIFELSGTGVTGNITVSSSVGSYTLLLFMDRAMYLGDLITEGGNSATLYAFNCNTSLSRCLGGVSGDVSLFILNDVRFSRPVVASGSNGGRWFNVEFNTGAHDFTGYAGTITADANSYQSFQTRVPTKGTVVFNLVDTALGMKYVPTTPSDWGVTPPTTVQEALDILAALL